MLAVLSLAGSGCWLQRGFDAGRTRFVTGDAPITPANAGQPVELWRTSGLGSSLNKPVVLGGDVYVTAGSRVARVSAATGAVAYVWTIAAPAGLLGLGLSAPTVHDGELDAGWSSARTTGSDVFVHPCDGCPHTHDTPTPPKASSTSGRRSRALGRPTTRSPSLCDAHPDSS